MSFKDNYIKFSEKFGGTHALIGKGLSKSNVNSIMAGSMPLADTACRVAKVLGVTVEDLVLGKGHEAHLFVQEASTAYREYNPEERHQVDKLLEILRHGNEEQRYLIIQTIDVLCDGRLWIKEGKPKRRMKQLKYSGNNKRKKPFVYKTTSKGH